MGHHPGPFGQLASADLDVPYGRLAGIGPWDARHRYVDSWPGGHHLVNVLLHAVNAVLLSWFCKR